MIAQTVPFLEAVQDVSAGNTKIPQSAFLEYGHLAVVDQGRQLIAGYTNDTGAAVKVNVPVIVFGDHTRALKFVDFPFAMGADGVKVLSARDGFDSKYVYHYLRSQNIPSAGYSRHFKFLREISIPKPTLPEQRRIGAILDHADALRTKRRQILNQFDALTQSVFNDMFGNPLTNSKGLPKRTIGSVAEVVTGNSPARAAASNFGDTIEWIKSGNLGGEVASIADEWLSDTGRIHARIAPSGSLLVTCIAGSPASIGKVSLVDRDVAFNQQINAILPNDTVNTSFLYVQLKTAPELVRAKSTGGMKGLVNKSAFKAIEILLPPIELQRDFAERINSISRLRSSAKSSLNSEDRLFASIQYRAFGGAL